MKKCIIILLLVFIGGCCQPEGGYERCVEESGTLCIDFYPKCPEGQKGK